MTKLDRRSLERSNRMETLIEDHWQVMGEFDQIFTFHFAPASVTRLLFTLS